MLTLYLVCLIIGGSLSEQIENATGVNILSALHRDPSNGAVAKAVAAAPRFRGPGPSRD